MGPILTYSKWKKLHESMVQLATVNLPNLNSDQDGTQNDFVNQALINDINAAAASVGIKATITTAKTGHSTYTKGGTAVSRHMDGTGIDIAILDGVGSGGATNSSNGNPKFRELGNKLKDALVKMGYVWNVERGNDKAVLWQTDIGGNHYNHLHISNRIGATALPGATASSDKFSLDLGASGEEVIKVQNKLGLTPTGTYDAATKAAVVRFQLDPMNKDASGNRLSPDGVVGDRTREALFRNGAATATTVSDPEKIAVGTGTQPVILMGGLDYREKDYDLSGQAELLLKNLPGDKKIIAHRYNKLQAVLQSISENPDAKVVLFSAGGSYAGPIANAMKNKNNLYVVEPYGIDLGTKKSVEAAFAAGVPAENFILGPSPARGIDVVSGATPTPEDKNHWGALEYAGELIT